MGVCLTAGVNTSNDTVMPEGGRILLTWSNVPPESELFFLKWSGKGSVTIIGTTLRPRDRAKSTRPSGFVIWGAGGGFKDLYHDTNGKALQLRNPA